MSEFQSKIFRELLVLVAEETRDCQSFGAVKVNKALFYADFAFYAAARRPITGAKYKKLKMGPAPTCLVPIRNELVQWREMRIEKRDAGGYPEDRNVALRPADRTVIGEVHLAFIEAAIAEVRPLSGTEVSHRTHQMTGYRDTEMGHIIPYESALRPDGRTPHRPFKRIIDAAEDRLDGLGMARALSEAASAGETPIPWEPQLEHGAA